MPEHPTPKQPTPEQPASQQPNFWQSNSERLEFVLYEFQLPLCRPLKTSYGLITHRQGMLLRLTNSSGQVGWGQSMLLPHQPAEVLSAELGCWTEQSGLPRTWSKLPYSETAFSLALADLSAKQADLPLYRWLLSNPQAGRDSSPETSQAASNPLEPEISIPLNALISADSPEAVAEAGRLAVREGYRAVKLKVGADVLADDIKRVKNLRHAIGDKAKLRLDANGAWDLPTAKTNLSQLTEFDIEYIEEPTSGLAALAELATVSPIDIAVDESIRDISDLSRAIALAKKEKLAVLIIKPTALGNIVNLWQTLRAAIASFGARLVVTSALDSTLGITAAGHFAVALAQFKKTVCDKKTACSEATSGVQAPPMEPCGLDTARLLAADLCDKDNSGSPGNPYHSDNPGNPYHSGDPGNPLLVSDGQLVLPKGPGLGLEPSTEALKHLTTQVTRGEHHV